ncbi:uncharacterized protein LOC126273105 isoform X1 [Schistocerca gregaria]|uniref:uncharacterized protein LOC126273105 isoform X1 n=1 Tax=Schistocerca gregaria TaxID=7010 RepID=UPI00211F0F45|nr:uncharacterized protein LOC126273105 isoform X1 [Schistocerca gregaria]
MKHRKLRRSSVGLYSHLINYSQCSLPTIYYWNSSNKKAVDRVMSSDAECRAVPPLRPVREQEVEVLLKYCHCYRHDVQSEPSPRPALTYVVSNVAAGKVQERQGGGETARQQPPQQHRDVVEAEVGEEEEEVGEAETSRGLLRRLLACCLCIRLPQGRSSTRTSRVHPEESPTAGSQAKQQSPVVKILETYSKEKQELVSAWVLKHFGSAQDRCRWMEGLHEEAENTQLAEVTYCRSFSYASSGE